MFKDELNQEIGKEINVQRDDTNPNNVFIIEGPHITFLVDPEFESSRENAVRALEKTENITYKWFKEESGEKHWVMYDSRSFEVMNHYGISYLRYIPECGIAPIMPVNGTSCLGMFSDMDLTGVNFDYFVTTDVVTMAHMFEESTGISSDMLKHFSTGNVRTMSSMFSESDVEILDLSHFETNSLEYVSEMFAYCEMLEEVTLDGWDFSQVVDFTGMFLECNDIACIYCSEAWDTSSDEGSEDVFLGCSGLPNYDEDETGIDAAIMDDDGGYLYYV